MQRSPKAGIQVSGGALGRLHTLGRHPHPPSTSLARPSIPCQSTPSGRPPQPTVMPAKAGIQWSGGHSSREASTLPSTPSWRPPQPTVMPAEGDLCVTPPVGDSVAEMASIPSGEPPPLDSRLRGNDGCAAGMTVVQRSPEASIQVSGGALYSGGIHTPHRPLWRGIHILPSTPSARPPQPTVMPADGDLCVTPPVGDSVAEMASIPSGEPPPLDSRLRGEFSPARE